MAVSVNDYKAFYSNMNLLKLGDVVNSLGFKRICQCKECVKHSITPEKDTIIETFQ